MCTNFTPTRNGQWVKAHFGVDLPADYPDEAYPGHVAPLVVKGHQTGRLACGLARFGLIPSWAKDQTIARHTHNARSETAAQKPSFKKAWHNRQYGLLLVDHFFEPSYVSGKAVRWKIERASGEPFGMACLWDRWADPASGEWVVSFAMLTVNADEHPVMRQFHKPGDEKRTPVVIDPQHHEAWLGANSQAASDWMNWTHMPELTAVASPKALLA